MDEINKLIDLAKQMGLIQKSFFNYLPNGTMCNTVNDIYKSHVENNHTVTVKLNDIYGMLVLLGLGVGLALITLTAETLLMVSTLN